MNVLPDGSLLGERANEIEDDNLEGMVSFFPKLPTAIRPSGEEFFDLAKMDAASEAWVNAGRPFPSINSMITEMAFFSHPFIGIELHHSQRTGLEAGLTTDAGIWINEDDTVRPLMDGLNRTHLFTGGFRALQAARRKKGQPELAIDSLHPFCFHLDPPRSFRWVILLLAGQLAGVAPPADFFIDDHGQSFRHLHSSPFLGEIRQSNTRRFVAPMAGSQVPG